MIHKGSDSMESREFKQILAALENGDSPIFLRELDGKRYLRKFIPEDRLIVLGGGHISQPLCHIAAMLDFAVTVVDDRSQFANEARFPEAVRIICDDFTHALTEHIKINRHDYVVVITRGHQCDAECLRAILPGTEPGYIGMIGSRRRVAGLKQLLKDEGYDAAFIDRIHSPIGLPIGAVTPAEIAISIIAQLIEHRRSIVDEDTEEKYLDQTNTDMDMVRFLADNDVPRALLTVLGSKGSTPVKSGAMMSIDSLGKTYGTIGGGCSEADALTRARLIIGTGTSEIMDVDLTNDVAAEEGMVCGGIMQVLIEDY